MALDLKLLDSIPHEQIHAAVMYLSDRWGTEGAAPAQVPKAEEPLLTAEQVAAQLGVKKSWVYEAARTGKLPVIKAGRYRRFRITDVERTLASIPKG